MLNLRLTLIVLLLCAGNVAMAQRELKIHNNEIGVMADVTIGDADVHSNLTGLQFRHFKSDIYRNNMFGYRVSAGVGNVRHYNNSELYYLSSSPDTLRKIDKERWQKFCFVGLGVDAQRRFYKSVWLYAAVNVTIGYGNCGMDSIDERYTANNVIGFPVSPTTTTIDLGNAFWIGIAPILGAKLEIGKRIWAGTEFATLLTIDNTPANANSGRTTTADFYLGRFNERFYVSFRF